MVGMLSLVDILLIVVVLAAAIGGFRAGATVVGGRLGGGLIGLAVGLVLASWAATWVAGTLQRALAAVLAVLVTVGLGAAYGTRVGLALRRLLGRGGLRTVDGLAGAVLRGGVALVLGWFVILLLGAYGPAPIASAADRATLPGRLATVLPPPSRVVGDVARALDIRWPGRASPAGIPGGPGPGRP